MKTLTVGKINLIRYWVKRAMKETNLPFSWK